MPNEPTTTDLPRREDYARNMEAVFVATSELYSDYWDDFFHFAVYDRDGLSREAAYERTHRRYLDALCATEAEDILVLACGRGGFAELIARKVQGSVLGIDISKAQLARARQRTLPNLEFHRHDIMRLNELDETFDAVACLDAACYLPDKDDAVGQIAHVLNPGGRLLLVDWCRQPGLGRMQEELVLHPFMRAWAISELATMENYRAAFTRHGLHVVEAEDLTRQVEPEWNHAYRSALRAVSELSEDGLARRIWTGVKLGPEGVKIAKAQFNAAVYIKAGFDLGFLRYTYLLGKKA